VSCAHVSRTQTHKLVKHDKLITYTSCACCSTMSCQKLLYYVVYATQRYIFSVYYLDDDVYLTYFIGMLLFVFFVIVL
jgi:hypothetical protein